MLGWAPACPCWVEGPEGSSWQGGQHGFETRTGAALATPRGHVLSPSTEEPAALSRSAGGGDVASPLAAMRFCPALEAPSQAGLGAGAGGLCPWRWEGSAGGGTVSSRRETGPGRPGRQPPRRCYSPGRRDGAGRDAWSLRATPARSPQTDWSAVPPPCRCSASQSRVLGTSWQLVGDGLAALRTLRPVTEGWTDCARWTRGTKAVLSPRFKDGRVGETSTPVFLPSGPDAGRVEAGAYKAGCPQAGRGREEQTSGRTGGERLQAGCGSFPVGTGGACPQGGSVFPGLSANPGRRSPCDGASPRGPPE